MFMTWRKFYGLMDRLHILRKENQELKYENEVLHRVLNEMSESYELILKQAEALDEIQEKAEALDTKCSEMLRRNA